MNQTRNAMSAIALGAFLSAPLAAVAATNTVHRTFDGTVVHVSTLNLKVKGLEAGKEQILSFDYLPRFGKASPIYKIHAGEAVRVTFDQKGAGARHVTRVQQLAHGMPTGSGMKM